MLPTTGFFKNIDCPYYEKSCDRPYCHFKHRKKTPEPVEASPAPQSTEIPTYNPTPKSQLANVRSHIPISYVPDLAIRTERNHFRSLSSYGFGDKQPTYNPTPLSILSTSKANSSKSSETKQYEAATFNNDQNIAHQEEAYSPTLFHENSNDINFEDLETEFDLIDEIISDSGTVDTANEETESAEDNKQKKEKSKASNSSKSKHHGSAKSNHSSSSSAKPPVKKHNGKLIDDTSTNKSKSDSKSKSGSHSSKKDKSETKHKKDYHKSSRSSKDGSSKKEDKKSSKTDDKKKTDKDKHESKERHRSRCKESSSEKEKHVSKPKERDKGNKKNEKGKKYKSRENESSKKKDRKTKSDETIINDDNKIKSNIGGLFSNDCDMSDSYDNGVQNYGDFEEDSDVEEDPMEECYKIFTEYKPDEPQIFPEITKQELIIPEETVKSHTKKRIAHENVDKYKPKSMFNKPKAAPTAAQAMVNRFRAVRLAQANNEQDNIIAEINRHVLKRPSETQASDAKKLQKLSSNTPSKVTIANNKNISKPSTSASLIDDIISGKSITSKPRRIAPVQNVNSIQRAKAKIEEMAKMKAVNAILKTATQTTSKGQKRVAHVPEYSVADVPDVLEAERSKLPVNVRSRYLTMILDECMKLYLSKEEAQQRAVNEEYKCYERCAALVTYRNSAMLAINRLRKELQEREMSGLGPIFPGETSSVDKNSTCELRGRKFYKNIKRYILNDEELDTHGFPREGTIPGRAFIKNKKQVPNTNLDEYDRVCSRCSKHYTVDEEGFALYEEECLYHPLKKRTFRGESIYLCCKTGEGAGCVTSPTHVCEKVNPSEKELEGYQTTMPSEQDDDPRSTEVFALDCEMCYTTKGLELTRVTIVNADCKTVYETLVKPLNPIIDYNTRFSGITEEQMNRTATSILQVQANILHLCNSNTILIGHSLESDMKALKIIHSSIIDTSVLFPHKFGLPHKRALRDLAREFLKKIIQNDVSGHDSAEDALTCMELVQWKLKEEFKARGVKV